MTEPNSSRHVTINPLRAIRQAMVLPVSFRTRQAYPVGMKVPAGLIPAVFIIALLLGYFAGRKDAEGSFIDNPIPILKKSGLHFYIGR